MTQDDAPRSVDKEIWISLQLKGALPLLGKILVHLKVSNRQLTQQGDSACLAAALALTLLSFTPIFHFIKNVLHQQWGKLQRKYTHSENKKESWTSLELGKYFNVCFAQKFVLTAVVVTVVMGCIGIFLGFDFQEGVPQVNKSQSLPNKCHKQTPVFWQTWPLLPVAGQTDVSF